MLLVWTTENALSQVCLAAIGMALNDVADPISVNIGACAVRVNPIPPGAKAPEIRTGTIGMLQIGSASLITPLIGTAAVGILPIGTPENSSAPNRLTTVWKGIHKLKYVYEHCAISESILLNR